jgi:hypothetical protein
MRKVIRLHGGYGMLGNGWEIGRIKFICPSFLVDGRDLDLGTAAKFSQSVLLVKFSNFFFFKKHTFSQSLSQRLKKTGRRTDGQTTR